ncbi:hypothetical protein CRD19_01000 [Corynebacterium sp. LK32]|nr:hypothetical protein [Corynebacterium sp. LK32]
MTYRSNYHLSPPQGRLNDPNGLFVDGETLHVFYQHDPCFPHAPKRTGWGHASASLTTAERWRHHPDALYPGMPYDKHGCYSGSAVVDGDDVWLFYTGNLKADGRRIPSQNRVRALDASAPRGWDSSCRFWLSHGFSQRLRSSSISVSRALSTSC